MRNETSYDGLRAELLNFYEHGTRPVSRRGIELMVKYHEEKSQDYVLLKNPKYIFTVEFTHYLVLGDLRDCDPRISFFMQCASKMIKDIVKTKNIEWDGLVGATLQDPCVIYSNYLQTPVLFIGGIYEDYFAQDLFYEICYGLNIKANFMDYDFDFPSPPPWEDSKAEALSRLELEIEHARRRVNKEFMAARKSAEKREKDLEKKEKALERRHLELDKEYEIFNERITAFNLKAAKNVAWESSLLEKERLINVEKTQLFFDSRKRARSETGGGSGGSGGGGGGGGGGMPDYTYEDAKKYWNDGFKAGQSKSRPGESSIDFYKRMKETDEMISSYEKAHEEEMRKKTLGTMHESMMSMITSPLNVGEKSEEAEKAKDEFAANKHFKREAMQVREQILAKRPTIKPGKYTVTGWLAAFTAYGVGNDMSDRRSMRCIKNYTEFWGKSVSVSEKELEEMLFVAGCLLIDNRYPPVSSKFGKQGSNNGEARKNKEEEWFKYIHWYLANMGLDMAHVYSMQLKTNFPRLSTPQQINEILHFAGALMPTEDINALLIAAHAHTTKTPMPRLGRVKLPIHDYHFFDSEENFGMEKEAPKPASRLLPFTTI